MPGPAGTLRDAPTLWCCHLAGLRAFAQAVPSAWTARLPTLTHGLPCLGHPWARFRAYAWSPSPPVSPRPPEDLKQECEERGHGSPHPTRSSATFTPDRGRGPCAPPAAPLRSEIAEGGGTGPSSTGTRVARGPTWLCSWMQWPTASSSPLFSGADMALILLMSTFSQGRLLLRASPTAVLPGWSAPQRSREAAWDPCSLCWVHRGGPPDLPAPCPPGLPSHTGPHL